MPMLIKYICILYIILIPVLNSFSQDNSIFLTHNEISDTNSQKLNFSFESTSFVKNNEYFDHLKGWTGIGFFIKPQLIYQPTKTTEIQAGYFLEKYSGLDKFNNAIPLLRIRQKLGNNWEMVLGHLYGNLEHKLSEPVYRFDRYYSDNVEYGMQFLFKNRFITNDFWANWEKFIFYNDPYREEFVLGNSFNAKFNLSPSFSLNLPFQFTWTHAGGQIYEHIPLRENIMSLYNSMAGIILRYNNEASPVKQKSGKLYLKNISLEYNFNNYTAGANPPPGDEFHQPYGRGFGSYIRCNIDFNALKTMIGYWKSEKFIAPRGEEIFLSAFGNGNNSTIPKVELINFKIAYDRKISDMIFVSFRTDLYYNLQLKSLLYSYGIYFVYNDLFPIRRF
jgi:hypothetical protein